MNAASGNTVPTDATEEGLDHVIEQRLELDTLELGLRVAGALAVESVDVRYARARYAIARATIKQD